MTVTKKLLDEYGVPPAELVEKLNVAKASVYAWVEGNHVPSRGNVNLMLDYVNVDSTEKHRWRMLFKKERGGVKYE